MSIYMKMPNITGNVSIKNYEKWIELTDLHFSTSRNIHTKIGMQADREFSTPSITEVGVSKSQDKSSPLLFAALLQGESMDEVTIAICRNGKDPKLMSQYVLHNVMVSHYEERIASDDHRSDEYLSLNFTKIEKRYIPYDSQGNAGAAISTGYDLSTAKMA